MKGLVHVAAPLLLRSGVEPTCTTRVRTLPPGAWARWRRSGCTAAAALEPRGRPWLLGEQRWLHPSCLWGVFLRLLQASMLRLVCVVLLARSAEARVVQACTRLESVVQGPRGTPQVRVCRRARQAGSGDLGIHTGVALRKGKEISISVPQTLVLSPEQAQQWYERAPDPDSPILSSPVELRLSARALSAIRQSLLCDYDQATFIMAAAIAAMQDDSLPSAPAALRAWASSLPDGTGLPLGWPPSFRMRGGWRSRWPELAAAADVQAEAVAIAQSALCGRGASAHAPFACGSAAWRLRRAVALVLSRAMDLAGTGTRGGAGGRDKGRHRGIVPGADLFNHRGDAPRFNVRRRGGDLVVALRPAVRVAAGAQVFASYGAHSPAALVLHYGFVPGAHDPISDHESLAVPWEVLSGALRGWGRRLEERAGVARAAWRALKPGEEDMWLPVHGGRLDGWRLARLRPGGVTACTLGVLYALLAPADQLHLIRRRPAAAHTAPSAMGREGRGLEVKAAKALDALCRAARAWAARALASLPRTERVTRCGAGAGVCAAAPRSWTGRCDDEDPTPRPAPLGLLRDLAARESTILAAACDPIERVGKALRRR